MLRYLLLFCLAAFTLGCGPSAPTEPAVSAVPPAPASAPEIIARAQQTHGSSNYEGRTVTFDFRKRQYRIFRDGGRYEYAKFPVYTDSSLVLEDVLNNDGFRRIGLDGQLDLSEADIAKYSPDLNSVAYFTQLPLGLELEAVNPELLGEVTIKGNAYHKVKVTFDEAGGGEDFEDVFLYYFRTDDGTMDYLAYTYAEPHGMGVRFREAFNRREVGGIVFQDYVNYKDAPENDFMTIEERFVAGELEELSRIVNENVMVEALRAY